MKFFKNILILGAFLPVCANAGSSNDFILEITANAFDQVIFTVGNVSNLPTCATSGRFIVSLTSEHGKAMYSMLLSAQAQNKKIKVSGKDTCDIRAEYESTQYVQLLN